MQEEEESTATAAQHNSSLTADIIEMICAHINYTLNWSIFFRVNCTCVAKPLAGQTEQTWHSLACEVKTEGKTVSVWGAPETCCVSWEGQSAVMVLTVMKTDFLWFLIQTEWTNDWYHSSLLPAAIWTLDWDIFCFPSLYMLLCTFRVRSSSVG
jgi:hypothetical protein